MPYIKRELREQLDENPFLALQPGELNYVLTTFILHSLGHNPQCPHQWDDEIVREMIKLHVESYVAKNGRSYRTYNEVFGVLSCIVLEMARREVITVEEYMKVIASVGKFMEDYYRFVVGPYEDAKIEENGEVYF
jgi:hypothetical protein